MHKLLSIASVLMAALAAGQAQSVNIATWMVELPETNSTNRAAEYAPLLGRVAGVLKPLNADIVLLHGIPSRTTTRQLTDLLRPRVYHNPILSAFKKSPQSTQIVEPSITLLSRKQAAMARTIEWRSVGSIEAPGGFSVAHFNYGSNGLFLYTAQFPKTVAGMTPAQEAAVPRHRELAARYLVAHLDWLLATSTNAAKFAYLATDLELEDTSITNDPARRVLIEQGFTPSSGSRTLIASTALSSTGWPPEGALVSAFVRGTEFPGDPESIGARTFFAPVALVDIDLRPAPARVSAPAPASAPAEALVQPALVAPASPQAPLASSTNPVAVATVSPVPAEAAAVAPGPTPRGLVSSAADPAPGRPNRWVPWAENRAVLIAGGGAIGLAFLTFVFARSRRSSRSRGLVSAGAERGALPPAGHRTGAGDSAISPIQVMGPPGRAVRAGPAMGRDEALEPELGPAPRASSWPFLHLVRERMVRWLAAERSQLLSSHHAGAEQVLELEERLTRIQNQFESRLRAREQRISELEVELMTKEKSIADLEQALTGRDRRS